MVVLEKEHESDDNKGDGKGPFVNEGRSGKGREGRTRRSGTASSRSAQFTAFMIELEAIKRLRGPYTVHTYGAVTSLKDRLVLVMELLPGGDLQYRLRKMLKPLDELALRGIVKDVSSGMAFLHAKAFIHGHLTSANIMFDAAGRAKVNR